MIYVSLLCLKIKAIFLFFNIQHLRDQTYCNTTPRLKYICCPSRNHGQAAICDLLLLILKMCFSIYESHVPKFLLSISFLFSSHMLHRNLYNLSVNNVWFRQCSQRIFVYFNIFTYYIYWNWRKTPWCPRWISWIL